MVLYIAIAIFPLLVGNYFNRNISSINPKYEVKKLRFLMLASLPMFLLIGLRHQSIGADTINYLNYFTRIDNTHWNNIFNDTRMEYGYIIFVKIISLFTDNPLVFQVICATIYWLSISYFSSRLEKSPFLFLFFFCTLGTYTFMFTGVRQCLAICICLFSYNFIKKQKLIPFLLLILLAFYFHKSSLLFIAAYFIAPRKINAVNTIVIAAFCSVSILYLDVIQDWFNEQWDYNYGIESTGNGFIFLTLLLIITILSVFLVFNNKAGYTKDVRGMLNIGFIAVFFWVLRLFTRVAERPSFYFIFFSLAAFAHSITIMKNIKERDIVKTVAVLVCLALYIYRFITNFATYVPYRFYAF